MRPRPELSPEDLVRHGARPLLSGPDQRYAPAGYYRGDVVLLPADATAPDDLARFNRVLAEAGTGAVLGEPVRPARPAGRAPVAVPVRGADALVAQRALLDLVPARLDRLLLVETVAPSQADVFGAFGDKMGHAALPPELADTIPVAPPWRDLGGRRRPVVAVLDSGVEPHPWFPTAPGPDPFVQDARDRGWVEPPLPTVIGAASRTAHATFIAGLIRQAGPDAAILSMRLMAGDGVVYESSVEDALWWLVGEVESHRPERQVDVVCLAFGRPEEAGDADPCDPTRTAVRRLRQEGVAVVVSAGNAGCEDPTFPALLAADPDAPPCDADAPLGDAAGPLGDAAGPLCSVGSGSREHPDGFSNRGSWVTCWRAGKDVLSTLPAAVPRDEKQTGFGWWSGTSFAAATLAGEKAQRRLVATEAGPAAS